MFIPKILLLVENGNKTACCMIWMSPLALMGLGPRLKHLGLWLGPMGWQTSGLACIRSTNAFIIVIIIIILYVLVAM